MTPLITPIAARVRPAAVYVLATVVGAGAFLYPFWLPARAVESQAHSADAPLVAALVGGLVVAAIALEVHRATMTAAMVAMLGVLAAVAGLLRLVPMPGGGNGIFFVVILAGAAFGPRFGLLLGLCGMAVSAVITGGIGPWLPFEMLGLAWMGATAGLVGRLTARLAPRAEVVALAAFGWLWGFVYGAILNLWFWPFLRDRGPLSWHPGLGPAETLHHYWSFYVATSLAWDAARALTDALLILVTGIAILRTFRRFAHRLAPTVELDDLALPTG